MHWKYMCWVMCVQSYYSHSLLLHCATKHLPPAARRNLALQKEMLSLGNRQEQVKMCVKQDAVCCHYPGIVQKTQERIQI